MNIEKELQAYKIYMQEKQFVRLSIRKHSQQLKCFLEWVQSEQLQQITYKDMLNYIRYHQEQKMSKVTINKYLLAVRHYFDCLNKNKNNHLSIQDYNPADNLQIRGVRKKLLHDYLEKHDLEALYHSYKGKYKIMLGLIVYQGLTVGELERLEKIHLNLQEGSIYIPRSLKAGSRTLKLESCQIYELMEHVQKINTSSVLGNPLQNNAQMLGKALRKTNPQVRNVGQLRGSLIVHWVKTLNLRQAQYLAGHTNVISTEHYKQINLEDLQQKVNKYHPLEQ
jgi:integrase/recombinase XerD